MTWRQMQVEFHIDPDGATDEPPRTKTLDDLRCETLDAVREARGLTRHQLAALGIEAIARMVSDAKAVTITAAQIEPTLKIYV